MKPPAQLGKAGRTAFRRAEATLRAFGEDPAASRDAIERFAAATDRAAHLRAEWDRLEQPVTVHAKTGGRPFAHPLIAAMAEAEKHAAALGAALGLDPAGRHALRRTVGRPLGLSDAPDRRARVVPLPLPDAREDFAAFKRSRDRA